MMANFLFGELEVLDIDQTNRYVQSNSANIIASVATTLAIFKFGEVVAFSFLIGVIVAKCWPERNDSQEDEKT